MIVVGFDGSDASHPALEFALEEARLRGAPLRIVTAWEVPAIEYVGAAVVPTPDLAEEAEHRAREAIDEALAEIGAHDGVEIETVVVPGHAPDVLVEQARDAALLVVGSRGHGTLAGLVLGSVSHAVAHRSTRPVVIVPHPH